MSEFYPTTYATFFTTFTPFDDYDHDPDFVEQPVPGLVRIPIQILTSSKTQYQPVDNRGTTIKTYSARLRGHYPLRLDYLLEDLRTGNRYSIDELDLKQNPVGDASWVLTIRAVDENARP